MRHAGRGRITIACAWADADQRDVPVEGVRTPLPSDLPAGAAATLPVRVRAPCRPGRFALTLRMIQEDVRWMEPGFGPFGVHVHAACPPSRHRVPASQPADMSALLEAWIPRSSGRVLAVGTGAPDLPGPLIVADDDLLALQLRQLRVGGTPRGVAADLEALPFLPASVDAIVGVAALQRVGQPARVLRALAPLAAPGGVIAVMDEPAWLEPPETDALAAQWQEGARHALSAGEWRRVFSRSGLQLREIACADGRLSARLSCGVAGTGG